MRKLFISQPMRGRHRLNILAERDAIKIRIEEALGEEVQLIDSYIKNHTELHEDPEKNRILCLAKSIEMLADADIVAFAPGWENFSGCRVEHLVATEYDKLVVDCKMLEKERRPNED